MSTYSGEREDLAQQPDVLLRDEQLYRWVQNLLRLGMLSSLALMVIGMLLVVALGDGAIRDRVPLPEYVARLATFDSFGVAAIGVVILLLTPVASVAAVFVSFLLKRDFKYALAAFIVLSVLAISVIFAI